MLSRMMYKPHISCLQKDIVTQNGITLTTDSEINKILLNGAEVYCIDTSKCYLYDEENKTLIEKSEINDILVDGKITPESVMLINNKVNNFIAEINDKIAQADIDKVVELANELDVLTDDISEINSSLNAMANDKADLESPALTGAPTINNNNILTDESVEATMTILEGTVQYNANKLIRKGGMVQFVLCLNYALTTSNSNVATVPIGFRPLKDEYHISIKNATGKCMAIVRVASNGDVVLYQTENSTTATMDYMVSFCYMVA